MTSTFLDARLIAPQYFIIIILRFIYFLRKTWAAFNGLLSYDARFSIKLSNGVVSSAEFIAAVCTVTTFMFFSFKKNSDNFCEGTFRRFTDFYIRWYIPLALYSPLLREGFQFENATS